ncbi:hypothetical protein MBLNU230_g2012t1 [Neophaeotheca triangularis]
MFGFIADILTSVTSILFPIFASYKALRTNDPSDLAPWLMYWTTLSLFLLVENQFYFILYWVPFYSWIRLGIHLYLVLPGQQGCVFIYRTYLHPFLADHERQIDNMISDAHDRAKSAGLDMAKNAVDYVKVNFLGQQPRQPTPPNSRNVSYSSALMSRFNMPSARQGMASAGTSDLFSLLGNALNQSTASSSTTRDAQAADLSSSSAFIPPNLSGPERAEFVNTNRDRLRTLLQAFDNEASGPATPRGDDPAYTSSRTGGSATFDPRASGSRRPYLSAEDSTTDRPRSAMHQSRSESEFEDLGYEAMPDPEVYRPRESPRPKSKDGSWGNFIWGNYGEKDSAFNARKER